MYDVIVIGGGVVGGTILRALSAYKLRVCLLEKESDVCMGQSRANSGIVHAGFDAKEGTLKAKFNVLGNRMMYDYAEELGVPCKKCGSLVVAFSEEEETALHALMRRGAKNGVEELRIVCGEELFRMEPNLSREALAALWAPTGGIVSPYELTIAAIGNAMDNGAELLTEFEAVSIEKGEHFTVRSRDGRTVEGKLVINCAGPGAERVALAAGDGSLHIHGRRGEYLLLDRESGGYAARTLFFAPTEKGKGILVSPTADGNLILGPTADETAEEYPYTTARGLAEVSAKAKKMCPAVPLGSVITSFAGVRAYSETHDFVLCESEKAEGLFHCAGIESPGLTSAPAIAEYVVTEYVSKKLPLVKKEDFCGRRRTPFFRNLSPAEQNALIAEDPAFGRIVCRCERVTEGEIVRAIRENPPARTVDAVKRRTRAGMGRCQGGFCQPSVAEILARELGVPLEEVTKSGAGSELLKEAIR